MSQRSITVAAAQPDPNQRAEPRSVAVERMSRNACFAVAAAKAGVELGCELFGHSIIANPQGEIIAMATTWDDELITADLNLELCTLGRTTIFAFEKHRRPEAYQRITSQIGAVDPPIWRRPA